MNRKLLRWLEEIESYYSEDLRYPTNGEEEYDDLIQYQYNR